MRFNYQDYIIPVVSAIFLTWTKTTGAQSYVICDDDYDSIHLLTAKAPVMIAVREQRG